MLYSPPPSSPTPHITQRQHFNYLRNNSCRIWNTFDWESNSIPIQDQYISINKPQNKPINPPQYPYQQNTREEPQNEQYKKKYIKVSFDQQNAQEQQLPNKIQSDLTRNTQQNDNKRRTASAFQKRSKLEKDIEGQQHKAQQNREKVINYIEQIRPYTRALSNTKFQDYFAKPAPQCYGRANTNQPIGGIIYGNHLKSFNINPHVYTNKPEYYQTHTTAINYGKRAKVCQDKKWKRLEKQLTKKLGLKQTNQAIKQGKQLIYVDVDDKNKNDILRENHQFQKANRQQIHSRQLQYKKQKHLAYLDNINQYYANKQQKISQNLQTHHSINYSGSQLQPEQLDAKLNQQVIYKYHDKKGNTRLAVDRHGMTCFVDMRFPENQPVYVEQLNNRSPIFPIKVQGEDHYIDAIRKDNCKKGRQEVYPSHYLLRNCQQPQVIKMLSNKTAIPLPNQMKNQKIIKQTRKTISNKKGKNNSPTTNNQNKSFTLTSNTKNQPNQFNQTTQPNYQTNQYKTNQNQNQNPTTQTQNNSNPKIKNTAPLTNSNNYQQTYKSDIVNQSWKNPQIAKQVLNTVNQRNYRQEYLPHNQMNPQCYKYASQGIGKIPYAK